MQQTAFNMYKYFYKMATGLTSLKDMHLPVYKFELQDLLLLSQTVNSDISQTSH